MLRNGVPPAYFSTKLFLSLQNERGGKEENGTLKDGSHVEEGVLQSRIVASRTTHAGSTYTLAGNDLFILLNYIRFALYKRTCVYIALSEIMKL